MVSNSPVKSVTFLWLCVSSLFYRLPMTAEKKFKTSVFFLQSQVLDATLSPIQSQIHFKVKLIYPETYASFFLLKFLTSVYKEVFISIKYMSIEIYFPFLFKWMWSHFLQFVLEVPLVNTVSIYVIDRKLLLRGLDAHGHF